ncbi:hypothetical protein B0H14DRAFT_2559579 [Mycena olivaceomarginata]|nr:hypothetical protein B0H14DRAFT_2559579 [Mycena olivaceomarginata]
MFQEARRRWSNFLWMPTDGKIFYNFQPIEDAGSLADWSVEGGVNVGKRPQINMVIMYKVGGPCWNIKLSEASLDETFDLGETFCLEPMSRPVTAQTDRPRIPKKKLIR